MKQRRHIAALKMTAGLTLMAFFCGVGAVRAEDAAIQRARSALAVFGVGGSGFCIDPRGYYVTLRPEGPIPAKLRMVLNPDDRRPRELEAVVVRESAESGLMIVRSSQNTSCVPPPLGSTADLRENMLVRQASYVSGVKFTVSDLRIDALRKLNGRLDRLALEGSRDEDIYGGGGPILNSRGEVVGIMTFIVGDTTLGAGIPIENLRALLRVPDVTVPNYRIAFQARAEVREIAFEVRKFDGTSGDYTVELTLPGISGPRTTPLRGDRSGRYSTSAALVELRPATAAVKAKLDFEGGSLDGDVPDQSLRIGQRSLSLSGIRQIRRENGALQVTLSSGETFSAGLDDPAALSMNVGGAATTFGLKDIVSAEFTASAEDRYVAYTLTVRDGSEILRQVNGVWVFTDIGANGPAVVTSSAPTSSAVSSLKDGEIVVVKLPAPVTSVILAGAGRYLALVLPQSRQVGIFDFTAGAIVKFLPLPSTDALVTAGAEKLFFLTPGTNVLERWSLRTFEREVATSFDPGARVDAIAVGSASTGPLLAYTAKGAMFFDAETLAPGKVAITGDPRMWDSAARAGGVKASPDGKTFVATAGGGIRLLRLNGSKAEYIDSSMGVQVGGQSLSHDGSLVFTGSGPFTTADLKPVLPERFRDVLVFPSMDPNYFLGMAAGYGSFVTQATKVRPAIGLYAMGDFSPLLTMPTFDELPAPQPLQPFVDHLGVQRRVYLSPSANLLVTIPAGDNQVMLRKFDIVAEFDKTGIDYFYVASMPVRTAERGRPYRYAIEVKSRKPGLTYRLVTGPPGMTVSAEGVVAWAVPASAPKQSAVTVAIRNAAGQQAQHTFQVEVK